MDFSLFHFTYPTVFWGLMVIPIMIALYAVWHYGTNPAHKLERFADKHLLPHLIKSTQTTDRTLWKALIVWSLAWAMGIAALAGPQWRYTDMQVYKPEKDLVIVLDLSHSMNAVDVKPSRLARAREEITDLIAMNHGLTIGLVAYAEVPHMVVPLTDDMRTILNLLPSLDTSLITIDGDRLKPALAMASQMLGAEPGHDKSILVVGDGDFEENNMADLAQTSDVATIYTLGVGTEGGAPIPDDHGGWIKNDSGKVLLDPLHAHRLQALSAAGHGIYFEASYVDGDIRSLLRHIGGTSENEKIVGKTIRAWDEGFYIPLLILACLLLPYFRKGHDFPALIIFMLITLSSHHARAGDLADWFRNPAQQGYEEFIQGHYDTALSKFSDPYQQGVAAYKSGQYDKAANLFKAVSGDGTPAPDATYNLGNAQLMQEKPELAIISYETVLKQVPNDADAKHNLEIARKMLQQKQEQQKQKQQKQQQADNQTGSDKNAGNNSQTKQGKDEHATGQKSQDQNAQTQPSQASVQSENTDNTQSKASSQMRSAQNEGSQTGQHPQNVPSSQQTEPAGTSLPAGANKSQADTHLSQSQTPEQRQANGQPQDAPGHLSEGPSVELNPSQRNSVLASTETQRDVNADKWLNHIQSDPASFLKNQFTIEEQEAVSKHEVTP
jgi:Ca-activated chloride channel family protein